MTDGEKVIAFIEGFCRVPEGVHIGKPLKLDDFQKQFILDVYDNPSNTSMGILSIARKNGKTGLIAGILLAHLVGPVAVQNSQIVSGAMSREQAGIVFSLCCKMINLNPQLGDLIHIIPSSKRLLGKPLNVEYRALAADGKTAHGLSPVLAILDEVGQVRGPRSDFIDAITTAQGAHENPLLLTISTQAANDADLLSVWIDDAINSNDPHTVCHLYTAPLECNLEDRKAWKAANPALGSFRSEVDMQRQCEKAVRMPSSEATFRNLLLNQRVSTSSPFVNKTTWDANRGEVLPMGDGHGIEWFGGLDLSARTDLTAFVLVGVESDGTKHVHPFFWTPEKGLYERAKRDRAPYDVWVEQGYMRTTPGATVDYGYIAAELSEIAGQYDIAVVNFDRWRIDVFNKELERHSLDLNMQPFGQGFKDMSPAIDNIESDLLNNRIAHGGHPVLTMCAANSVITKDPAGNRKLDKHKATGRIDGMVALTMAIAAIGQGEEESIDIDAFLYDPLIL